MVGVRRSQRPIAWQIGWETICQIFRVESPFAACRPASQQTTIQIAIQIVIPAVIGLASTCRKVRACALVQATGFATFGFSPTDSKTGGSPTARKPPGTKAQQRQPVGAATNSAAIAVAVRSLKVDSNSPAPAAVGTAEVGTAAVGTTALGRRPLLAADTCWNKATRLVAQTAGTSQRDRRTPANAIQTNTIASWAVVRESQGSLPAARPWSQAGGR